MCDQIGPRDMVNGGWYKLLKSLEIVWLPPKSSPIGRIPAESNIRAELH